jgi:dihydropteroate synthase
MHWQTTRFRIDLSRPRVMGIVNVTPDSFSDGGRHANPAAALAHAERLMAEGADILDIGGESTRPGSVGPGTEQELARVLPVVRGALQWGVPISVDTSDVEVMRQVLDLGADVINDVRALRHPGAMEVVAKHGQAGACLMHMRGEPADMAQHAHYTDVVSDVRAELAERVAAARAAGIADERLVLDPGYGFAKSAHHNLQLLSRQAELLDLGRPLLVGWSRKGTLGQITGRPSSERLAASVTAALAAVARGACVVRVHDVAATVDALKVWRAAEQGGLDPA